MKKFSEYKLKKDNDLAKKDIYKIISYSEKIQEIIKDKKLEDWVKAKLNHAEDYIGTVLDFLSFYEPGEKENKMSLGNLKNINYKSKKIQKLLSDKELKDWVKAKLNLAGEYLDDVYHHLDGNHQTGELNKHG